MLIISRKTGELLQADAPTQKQIDDAAFAVFRAFCDLHPEAIAAAVAEYTAQADSIPYTKGVSA